jgi:integrase/recombinase XerD
MRRRCDSLPDLLDDFLEHLRVFRRCSPRTIEAYGRDVGRFMEFVEEHFPDAVPNTIKKRHVVRWASSLDYLAASSVSRAIDATSSFFRYLEDEDVVESNPVSGVRRPRQEQTVPTAATPEDCRRLMAAADTSRERAMIGLLAYLGLRRSELLALNVSDCAPDLSSVTVNGKGNKQRRLPVPPALQAIIQDHLQKREYDAAPLLLNRAGKRLGVTSLYRLWRRILVRADLTDSDLTPHSMRHGAATAWVRSGVDIRTIQRLLGHSSIETTAKYLHTNDATMQQAVATMPDFRSAPPAGEEDKE